MKFTKSIGLISLAFLLVGGESQAEIKLLPGVQYHGAREKLKGRLLFVRLRSGGPGASATSSYFIVNVATGDTKVLLRDTVAPENAGFMSEVRWVRAEE